MLKRITMMFFNDNSRKFFRIEILKYNCNVCILRNKCLSVYDTFVCTQSIFLYNFPTKSDNSNISSSYSDFSPLKIFIEINSYYS